MNTFSFICKDIISQEKFVFISQTILFQDNNFEIMNITRSITCNNVLSAFLKNSILFVKTKSNDLNIGCYPHSFPSQEIFIQSSQIEGVGLQQIEISYQRLSPSELQQMNHSHSDKFAKRNSKKNFKESSAIEEESYQSGSSQQYTNYNNNKKLKTDNLIMSKSFKEDCISDFEEEEDVPLMKHKSSGISYNSSKTHLSQTKNIHQVTNCSSIISTSDSLSKNEEFIQSQQNNNNNSCQSKNLNFMNINNSRSKERTIQSAIEIVSQWRDRYNKYKEGRVFRDLQEIAEEIGLSKKVLDYYFLELRTAEFFGFDFESNLNQKFGKVRKFNNSSKQMYVMNNNCKKIPINSNFTYRLTQNQQIEESQNKLTKSVQITHFKNISPFDWNNSPQFQNNIYLPYNQSFNLQSISL